MSIATKLRQVMTIIEDFSKANPGAKPSNVDDTTKQRLLVAFNGFKLLQGFIGHLRSEMREFISNQTGVPLCPGGDEAERSTGDPRATPQPIHAPRGKKSFIPPIHITY
jgi:hypothetical protein